MSYTTRIIARVLCYALLAMLCLHSLFAYYIASSAITFLLSVVTSGYGKWYTFNETEEEWSTDWSGGIAGALLLALVAGWCVTLYFVWVLTSDVPLYTRH